MTVDASTPSRPATDRGRRPAERARGIGLVVGIAVVLVACGPATLAGSSVAGSSRATASPPAIGPSPVRTSPADRTPAPTATHPAATPPTTTKTAWGTIWDDLPRGFPIPSGAEPTETGDPDPVSAALAVSATVSSTVEWYRTALPAAGYGIADVNGPYENGGYVIDAVGASHACRLQVSVARTGTTATISILFGAGCPFRS